MWIKLLMLLLYLLVLFLISRLLEAAAWYEAGFISYRILDPFSLSVKKIKRLLESRGVNYAGFVEKKDLTSLVQASGEVSEGEMLEITSDEKSVTAAPSSAHFTSGSHFYEEVEDTKDSIWLVQVIPPSSGPLLDDLTWRKLHSRISPFGVLMGVFDCSVDRRLCAKKGWLVPQLILAIPKGHRAKDTVVLHSYPFHRPVRLQPILDWLQRHLISRVHQISSIEELKSGWLNYTQEDKSSEVRLLLFSVLLDPPLFLLALGVKFSGRVKVGMVQVRDKEKTKVLQELNLNKLPCYLVVTPEKMFVYGRRIGEYFTYRRMEIFLDALRPETNDIFLASLTLVNLLGILNFFFLEGRFWRHLMYCLWRLGKTNCILFLIWLIILGLGHFSFMENLSEFGLTIIRIVDGSDVATILRNDWQFWKNNLYQLLILLLVMAALGGWVYNRYIKSDSSSTNNQVNNASTTSDWWSVSLDSYLMDCFFRPMASLTQPLSPGDMDLEEGMEMLIERLAVPNFWLQPVISSDYIKSLPVWTHCQHDCRTNENDRSSSETDDAITDITSEDEGTASSVSERSNDHVCRCSHSFSHSVKTTPDLDARNSLSRQCKCHSRNCCRKDEKHQRDLESMNGNSLAHRIPSDMLPCHECAICLEMYKPSVVLCGLPCGHNYHQQCILLWLSRDNHHCPVCRWPAYKSKLPSPLLNHHHTE